MQIEWSDDTIALLPDQDRRLSPSAAVLVLSGMSVALWSVIFIAAGALL